VNSFEVKVDPIKKFEFARRHGGRRRVPRRMIVKWSVKQSRIILEYCSKRCSNYLILSIKILSVSSD